MSRKPGIDPGWDTARSDALPELLDLAHARDLEIEPTWYQAILVNDDITPTDFVVLVVAQVFHLDKLAAERVVQQVHREGQVVVGVYPFDIAETKADQVVTLAQRDGYPLKCIIAKI